MATIKLRQRSPRWSLMRSILGTAVLLVCAMVWYAVISTDETTTAHLTAPTGMIPSRASYASSSLETKKQKARFQRPRTIVELMQNAPMSSTVQETENAEGVALQVEEGNEVQRKEMNSRESIGNVDVLEELNPDGSMELQTEEIVHDKLEISSDKRIQEPHPIENHPCSKFKAFLHIESGDQGAAAGTLFFQYMINQLIYADMHNLMPFIHLNNVTYNVYDEEIHGAGNGVTIKAAGKLHVPWQDLPEKGAWPGKPYGRDLYLNGTTMWFRGTGVWNHYLEPVSKYDPNHQACQALKYVTLNYEFLNPGIQFYAPWAVRSWEYQYMPAYLRAKQATNGSLHAWFAPQRIRAHEIIEKYFTFKPNLVEAAKTLVPDGMQCLAVHIRHSDKAGLARRKIPAEDFLPYVNTYLMNGGKHVYLATDSSRVLEYAERGWHHVKLIAQGGIVRSAVRKPVFRQGAHNRTNAEVLVDILAMARCQFMIHGYSAVSESSHYVNPGLHNRSVDLEDPNHMNISEFGALVKRVIG